MTQTTIRFSDEVARLMNELAGVASGMRREFVRSRAERILRDLDLVTREEFEAVKEGARVVREECEALKTRMDALEAELSASRSKIKTTRKADPAATANKRPRRNA